MGPILLGLLAGSLLLCAALLGRIWLLAFAVASVAGLAVSILGTKLSRLELIVMGAFVFCGSTRIDLHLGYSRTYSGYPLNILDVLWITLMALWAARLFVLKERATVVPRYHYPFMILFIGVFVAGVRAPTFTDGLQAILLCGQTYLLFLYLVNHRFERADYSWLAVAIAGTLIVQSLVGVLQEATQSTLGLDFFGASQASFVGSDLAGATFSRVGGTIGHPNQFASFLSSLLFVPLAMALQPFNMRMRVFYAATFAAGLVTLLLTRSRGGWLGFFSVLFAIVGVALYRRMGTVKAMVSAIWIVIVFGAVVLLVPTTRDRLIEDDYGAAESRIPMNLTALSLIADNPVFGVGHDNYMLRFHAYDVSEDGQSYRFVHPVHNVLLLLAAENGIPAALAFIAIIVVFFRDAWSMLKTGSHSFPTLMGVGIAAGVAGKLVGWQFGVARPMMDAYLWFMMGLTLSIVAYSSKREVERAP